MKTVVITGAGRGIGLGLTKEFLKNGDRVITTYRDKSNAKELFAISNDNLIRVTADVSDEKSLAPLKDELKKLGKIDILINNSGVIGSKAASLSELNFEDVAEVLDVNTLGPMRVTKLAMPFLKDGSTVAHVSSLMGSIQDNGSGGYYDYRMSKTALNMFNKCLSVELKKVTCLVVHPGWVQTDMGGSGATTTVEQSTQGLFKIISGAKPTQSGKFIEFTGKELHW